MTCQPSYSYRPDFIASTPGSPSGNDCTAPQFVEHRSRLISGDAFFRSIDQSSSVNFISLEITESGGNKTLDIRRYNSASGSPSVPVGSPIESEQFTVVAGVGGSPCIPDDIASLRSALEGSPGSTLVEMTVPVGFDIFDPRNDEVACLPLFNETLMGGGSGGPTDDAGLASIRTGPERTMFIIRSTEDDTGVNTAPPASRRVQQWDGTQWISYCNLVGGSPQPCPLEGTC